MLLKLELGKSKGTAIKIPTMGYELTS